jgi:dihydroxyacid dehydratase/phosphogluconate dehydratase
MSQDERCAEAPVADGRMMGAGSKVGAAAEVAHDVCNAGAIGKFRDGELDRLDMQKATRDVMGAVDLARGEILVLVDWALGGRTRVGLVVGLRRA